MNDKNFIEELRQKREEYGVTQTRLAVACGISRELIIPGLFEPPVRTLRATIPENESHIFR